jgi:endonuclease/exonuclease/phosphatase family metal-dependent hydrolase
MSERAWFGLTKENALRFTRLAACTALVLAITSCGKSNGTPDWKSSEEEQAAIEENPPGARESEPATETTPAQATSADEQTSGLPAGLRFVAYNVENWLTMDRMVDNRQLKNAPKPDSEKKAVIKLLANNKPDIIGLCEIGEAKDFAEIQKSLKAAGLDLPHSYYTGGSDPVRHLGLLSRFPIISTAKPAETDFRLNGQTFSINRGILDATIKARGKSYRFLGVHLKSKRVIEDADQEEMRVHEARLLRRHVDALLRENPQARLIVYGDFNDTRSTKTLKTITGSYNDPGYLTAIPAKDSRGDAWTHHWALQDVYSRIDFITVSRSLRPEVDFRASRIIDDPDWSKASDHRPLLAIFK